MENRNLNNRIFPFKNFVEFIEFDQFIWNVCGIKLRIGNCKLPVMKISMSEESLW